ncbi:MAG: biotin--acetyl-CoA-carboxylase ligase [Desulfovibrio sp.]|jgi:BirA family biotin operon repressor/biotin-[acetyl-CoA-carboxylase] ligase|nr:biotin--acetyl-CoA-carboxylase ligase [Desulfovibrio sp.]
MIVRENINPESPGPVVWRTDKAASSLDVGFMLAERGALAVWDSVIVKSQSAGRGQLRRQWRSPPGNIYATLRLPRLAPFDDTAASPATGLLFAMALRSRGWPVLLKWPNDLILQADASFYKLGGILLEERGEILLAGVGINVTVAPMGIELREDTALRATSLSCSAIKPPFPEILWRELVNHVYSAYNDNGVFLSRWKAQAEQILLWRGDNVELCEGGQCERGRLVGLSAAGGLCLHTTGGQLKEFLSGTHRLVQ